MNIKEKNMGKYLCYDLKGIQHYIFQVPKLKCCIGGSRQIDGFDKTTTEEIARINGVKKIYAGGGKGAFECETEQSLDEAKKALIAKTHELGLTIRFGINDDYCKAAQEINETYSYQPESLKGQPCSMSGLYPTEKGIHPLIKSRIELGGKHDSESEVEKALLKPIRDYFQNNALRFFYNVNANDRDSFDKNADANDAKEAAVALGNRNRWAVVCMDGNDMGMQFLEFKKKNRTDQEWKDWLKNMSLHLDEVTCNAAAAGMKKVAELYLAKPNHNDVLPLRPLIVGGDDVTVLVGCEYAFEFVREVIRSFNNQSKKFGELWVGTQGELTISAGILFAPVTLPLHSAIEYAELLLKSAKTKGRNLKKGKGNCIASPSCLDWESVTEGLLDNPGARRKRELLFNDEEINKKVELTERPYSMEGFDKLEKQAERFNNLPRVIQYQLHPSLYAPLAKRLAFYAKIGKNYPELKKYLQEPVPISGLDHAKYGEGWTVENDRQTTGILDALLLLQEENRMDHPTINEEM